MCTFIIKKGVFILKPTIGSLAKESMGINIQDPFLQFGVFMDLSIILVVVAEHSLHKPLRRGYVLLKHVPHLKIKIMT